MNARNTFEDPDALKPEAFTGYKTKDSTITVHMPAKSVIVLAVKRA